MVALKEIIVFMLSLYFVSAKNNPCDETFGQCNSRYQSYGLSQIKYVCAQYQYIRKLCPNLCSEECFEILERSGKTGPLVVALKTSATPSPSTSAIISAASLAKKKMKPKETLVTKCQRPDKVFCSWINQQLCTEEDTGAFKYLCPRKCGLC